MKIFLAAFAVFLMLVGGGVYYGYTLYQDIAKSSVVVQADWELVQGVLQKRAAMIPEALTEAKSFPQIKAVVLDRISKAHHAVEQLSADSKTGGLMRYKEFQEFQKIQNDLSRTLNYLWEELDKPIPLEEPRKKSKKNSKKETEATFNPTRMASLRQDLASLNANILEIKTRFNTSVEDYNNKVIKFPTAIVALMYGFERRSPFDTTNLVTELP